MSRRRHSSAFPVPQAPPRQHRGGAFSPFGPPQSVFAISACQIYGRQKAGTTTTLGKMVYPSEKSHHSPMLKGFRAHVVAANLPKSLTSFLQRRQILFRRLLP